MKCLYCGSETETTFYINRVSNVTVFFENCVTCGFRGPRAYDEKSAKFHAEKIYHQDNDIIFERGNAVVKRNNLASWAKWIAVNRDGRVYQYNTKPASVCFGYNSNNKKDLRLELCGAVGFECEDWKELLFEVNTTSTSQLYIVVADVFFNDSWNTVVIDSDADKSKCDSLAQELGKHNNYRNIKVMLAFEIEKE